MPSEMPKVYEGDCDYAFVCYAHADRDVVLPIISALVAGGYRVWYDDGIEIAEDYPEYIAEHIRRCASFVTFVSPSALDSTWCKDEMNYALDLGKERILPIYLDEDAKLTPGLQMRMGRKQAILWYEFHSDGEFLAKLFKARKLDRCLTEEGRRRRGVKPRGGGSKSAKKQVSMTQTVESKLDELQSVESRDKFEATGTEAVETRVAVPQAEVYLDDTRKADGFRVDVPEFDKHGANEHGAVVPEAQSAKRQVAMPESAEAQPDERRVTVPDFDRLRPDGRRVTGDESAEARHGDSRNMGPSVVVRKARAAASPNPPVVEVVSPPLEARGGGFGRVNGVEPKERLDDYSWVSLKRLSRAIAAAASDAEGLAIAREYSLLDKDHGLRGEAKAITLKDGTRASVHILGFRHDELAGGGKAGISFEFADVPTKHRMNTKSTNWGGWERSGMRKWLNDGRGGFLALLPGDLRPYVAPAKKRTNNRGRVPEGDTSSVTATYDTLWLLSVSEVYGRLSAQRKNALWSAATYDAEGAQYKLYADKGVTTSSYGPCKKRGADLWWWLRSPSAYGTNRFRLVGLDGDWGLDSAYHEWGVSPGFCF